MIFCLFYYKWFYVEPERLLQMRQILILLRICNHLSRFLYKYLCKNRTLALLFEMKLMKIDFRTSIGEEINLSGILIFINFLFKLKQKANNLKRMWL